MTMLCVLCCKPESEKEMPVEDHDGEDEEEEDDDVSGFQGLEETMTI